MDLSNVATCDLVAELEKRSGVIVEKLEPYAEKAIPVSGPAVVLVVID